MDLIRTLEQEEITRLNKTIPVFAPGDTVDATGAPSGIAFHKTRRLGRQVGK